MVVKTHKDTENATITLIIFVSLLLAIIAHVDYHKAKTERIRNRCHDWFTVCYSIAGSFIFLALLKCCKQPEIKGRVSSQKSIEMIPV
jgi:predicted membrane channel-forming protein YqfA (hemolysin III family)